MTTAILGSTGFVGSNIALQVQADELHSSKTIDQIQGKDYDIVYCAAAPGAKWLANKEPEKDGQAIDSLIAHLFSITANHFVLISTVDVYPKPIEVDESTKIYPEEAHTYGLNRLRLEAVVRRRFKSHTVLRLPGLFGPGLKKNVIFDFLNDNQTDRIHSGGVFQFYSLDHLIEDVERCRSNKLSLVNVATEPVSVRELAQAAFDIDFDNATDQEPARYDFRSKHAEVWSGTGGYLYSKKQVLAEMRQFVENERGSNS